MAEATHEKVLALFKKSDALLQGHFKLTSGKHSEWYFEKIRLIEKPASLDKIVDLLVDKIRRESSDFDYVVSPAYGAIAIGILAALKLGKRFAFTQRVEEKMAFRRPAYTSRPRRKYGRGLSPSDLIPFSHHVALPCTMGYDINLERLLVDKEEFLDRALAGDWIVVFEHDPDVPAARLKRDDNGHVSVREPVSL